MLNKFLIIPILLLFSLSCYSNSLENFLKDSVYVKHQMSFKDNKILIVEKKSKSSIKENAIIVINNAYEVVAYFFLKRSSNWFPVSENQRYVALGGYRSDEVPGKVILIYDFMKKRFVNHNTEYMFLGNIFLNENQLYYSSEKGFPTVNKFDLLSQTRITYEKKYLPNARFFLKEGSVYAIQTFLYPNKAFKINNFDLSEEDFNTNKILNNQQLKDIEDNKITILLRDIIVQ